MKQLWPSEIVGGVLVFSALMKRGSIEAMRRPSLRAISRTFSALMKRGSIEARLLRRIFDLLQRRSPR